MSFVPVPNEQWPSSNVLEENKAIGSMNMLRSLSLQRHSIYLCNKRWSATVKIQIICRVLFNFPTVPWEFNDLGNRHTLHTLED